MATASPVPSIDVIEDYLLLLVSRDAGKSLAEVRREEELFPEDPPWDSEMLTKYVLEIEDYFGLEFDPIEVERHSRTLRKLSLYIFSLLGQKRAETA